MKVKFIKLFLLLILWLNIIIIYYLFDSSGFISYYSNYIYRSISNVQSYFFGSIYFPMGDLIYLLFFSFIIYYMIKFIVKIKTFNFKKIISKLINVIILSLSIITIFYYLWGFNYYREDIVKTLGIYHLDVNDQDVLNLAEFMVKNTNELRQDLKHNSKGHLFSNIKKEDILDLSYDLYNNLEYFNRESNYRPNIKLSLFSSIISSFGVTGYYNPFTGEANLNKYIPDSIFPFVSCHEIAHQKGYAKEQDCNLIAFLVCNKSDIPYVRYSAYLSVLRYVLSDVYYIDKMEYKRISSKLSYFVKKDIDQIKKFFISRRSKVLDYIFDNIFNTFLKINNQKDGIRSYNRVVKLLAAMIKKDRLQSL